MTGFVSATAGDAKLIQQKLSFPSAGPDQAPGVVVMRLDDTVGSDVDKDLKGMVVIFNASDEAAIQAVPGAAGASYSLHSVQASGADPIVKTAAYDPAGGSFTVPARTVAVFQAK